MFIKTLGLLLVLLSSYNRLAALGLVLALMAISCPRGEEQNSKEKVIHQRIELGIRYKYRCTFRKIFPSKKLLSWLLKS